MANERHDSRAAPPQDRFGLPGVNYPTANIEDLVIVEDVPIREENYAPLLKGTPHPIRASALLVSETPRPGNNTEKSVRRIYATTRDAQDAYNLSTTWAKDELNYPIHIRTYIEPREGFTETTIPSLAPLTCVTGLDLTAGGSGYASVPPVLITGAGGSGATAIAQIQSGAVVALLLTAAGSGFTGSPTVFIGFAEATGGAVMGVGSVVMTAGGTGYLDSFAVTFTGGSGSAAAGTATASGGVITGVVMDAPGIGYTSAPTADFSAGGGTGADATVSLGGPVLGINLISGGADHVLPPTIYFDGLISNTSATATLGTGGAVVATIIDSAGTWDHLPAVTFVSNDPVVPGSGATATASIQASTLKLIHEETAPADGELGTLFLKVTRIYAGTDTATSSETDGEGNNVRVTKTMRPAASQPNNTATSETFVRDLGNGYFVEEVRSVGAYTAGVFFEQLFDHTKVEYGSGDPIPQKFLAAIRTTQTTADSAADTAVPDALGNGVTGILQSSSERVKVHEVRKTKLERTVSLPLGPLTTHGLTNEFGGGITTLTETFGATSSFSAPAGGLRIVTHDLAETQAGFSVERKEQLDASTWPVLSGSTVDQATGVVVNFTQQTVAAGVAGGVTTTTFTDVAPLDFQRSRKTISTVDPTTMPVTVEVKTERNDVIPPRFLRRKTNTITTTHAASTTVTPDAVGDGVTGILRSTAERVRPNEIRKSSEARTIMLPLSLSTTRLTEQYGGGVTTVTETFDALTGLTPPIGGLTVLDDELRAVSDLHGVQTTETLVAGSWPVLHGTAIDESTQFVTSFTTQTVAAGTAGGISGSDFIEVRPLDFKRSEKRITTPDTSAIDSYHLTYPGIVSFELPDVLTGVTITYNNSSGTGAHSEDGAGIQAGTSAALTLHLSSRAQGSAATIAKVTPTITQKWAHSVPATHYLFYLPDNSSDATVATKLNSLAGATVNAWPRWQPTPHNIVCTGQHISVSAEADAQQHVETNGSDVSYTHGTGGGTSSEVGLTIEVTHIPPTIHGSISFTGASSDTVTAHATAAVGWASGGASWPAQSSSRAAVTTQLSGFTVVYPGSGYTSVPTVILTGGAGSGAAGTAVLGVESVTVTAGGSGYTSAPAVAFTGGSGSGAAGTANLSGGVVVSITMTNAGTGYTSVPSVGFSGGGGSGAAGTAKLGIESITLTSAGTGYTSAPAVTFTGGSPSSGALAIAGVSNNTATASVSPTSLSATTPAAIPTTGLYQYHREADPYRWGYTRHHAIVVDFGNV